MRTPRNCSLFSLLDPRFELVEQPGFWEELEEPLRFVIKLHRASRLHYDFRLELFGRLFSLVLEKDTLWDSDEPYRARRVDDHDPRHLLAERNIPEGQYGAGPVLVWDHGTYQPIKRSDTAQLSVYEQLQKGRLELQLSGFRVRGLFVLEGDGEHWRLQRMVPADMPVLHDQCSVLTGRSLDEIEQGIPARSMQSNVLWLEWQHYYTDNTISTPQVVMRNDLVIDTNIAASRRKIVKGMRKHQVRALVQECIFTRWEPDKARSHAWLRKCIPFSGRIEPIDEHIAAIDLSGHSNVADIAHQIVRTLESCSCGKLMYGNGNSKWTAEFSAKHGLPLTSTYNPSILLKYPTESFSAVEESQRERLQFLGYRTIGQVARLPLEILQGQFGPLGMHIYQAARGFARDAVDPVFPGEELREVASFAPPVIERLPVEKSLAILSNHLAIRLSGNRAGELSLILTDESGQELVKDRKFNRPLGDNSGIRSASRILFDQMQGRVREVAFIALALVSIETAQAEQRSFFFDGSRPSIDASVRAVESAMGHQAIVKATDVKLARSELVRKLWREGTKWNDSEARWREVGEWWNGDGGREIHRYVDAKGTRREVVSPFKPSIEVPDISEIRVRRVRDEKVSLATGHYTQNSYGNSLERDCTGVLLHARSAHTYGHGTMLSGELPAFAKNQGYGTALLADSFSLVGAREFCRTAYEIGVKPILGATFEMEDGGELVLIARNAGGYRSLSRLITECHLEEPRLYPLCTWKRLARHTEGLLCLSGGSLGLIDLRLARRDHSEAVERVKRLIRLYGRENVYLQVERSHHLWQISVEYRLRQLADELGLFLVAGGPVVHFDRTHYPAHDVLACIETLCLIDEIEGRKPARDPTQQQIENLPRRSLNAERYLRDARDLKELFADSPDLLDNAQRLADRCDANVLPGRVELPRFCEDEDEMLRQLVYAGALSLYPKMIPSLRKRIDMELGRMTKLGWARHFLIAWEMCEWAKGQNILLSGRGSVVDSVVAYCLGISRVDAFKHRLYFDRFLPPDGSKRPDIDIDFEAARREDVRQHLVHRYGDAHVATVAAIGTYGTRGILREVGKVMGIAESAVAYLAKRLHGSVTVHKLETALDARPELRDSNIPRERYYWVFKLAERMMDLPRNLRAHSSGVVISQTPICDIVPVQLSGAEGVKIIQWDKRSAKHSFDKFDVLCLRGNDVLGGTARKATGGLDVTSIPLDDPEVYRTMRAGQLIGIPQSASPAMRQAHIRIKTKHLKDAAIVQAGIRPGVGGAVKLNEYIARRRGKQFRYLHPKLEKVLGRTMGIVVFQEQIDDLLETFGGYSGDEAEEIREEVQKHNKRGLPQTACTEILDRIVSRGFTPQVAQEVYTLVSGFKGYGFAEGHAFAFAEVSVRSIYCQQNYPALYFAALLDAQPAGYYGPVTIANEARSRGVKILPPDVNLSQELFGVEDVRAASDPKVLVPASGIRVPLRQIAGLSKGLIERAVTRKPYESMHDFVARAEPNRDELEILILVGAFDAFCPNRRALLWAVMPAMAYGSAARKMDGCLPLMIEPPPVCVEIEDFSAGEKAIYERRFLGLDVEHHLMAFERPRIVAKGGLTSFEASNLDHTKEVFVVGNPIRLRFPPTQSGKRVMFFDLEDETGLLNVTCFDDIYQRDGHKVICNPYITLFGEAQNRDGHIAFMAHRIIPYMPRMEGITDPDLLPIVTGDFLMT